MREASGLSGMLQFDRDADFGTEEHRARRDDGWMGGPFTELPYFLSCLTRVNYVRTTFETWEPALREFVQKHIPDSAWITRSRYFHSFAILILRELYRQSELDRQYPYRAEHRTERATRFVIAHPQLSLEELASRFGTTAKQLERNSDAMLAFREFRRLQDSAT
jgi:hypothetical protein